jgi:hypothetical protein
MHRFRKLATGTAVCLGLLVLSATPADARPVIDQPVQYAPGDSATHRTVCFTSVWPWKTSVWCFRVPR